MKKLLFLPIFIFPLLLFGQDKVRYTYDSSGNRTKKEVIILTQSSQTKSEKVLQEVVSEREIKIYPNPTKGLLKIEIPDVENITSGEAVIYNMSGQLILKKKLSSKQTEVDLSSRPKGVYILHISIDKEKTVWKIIKE